ncbi:MAG: acylphosphatase [Candidatus Omnitrophica bacterium]|nr:acylphosphatase [Candidatus Omnitrophota bacterium]
MRKQLHIYFSGAVQGVGFRFTAVRLANSFDVTGWVKNLPDGRVEIMAEQEEEVLKDFLNAIRNKFEEYIRDVEAIWSEAGGEFKGFEIGF